MALSLNTEYVTPSGYTLPSTYWRWVGMGVDVTTQTATVTLYAYVDEAAFLSGKAPVGQRQFTVSGQQFAELTAPVSELLSDSIYAYAMTDPQFEGAVEV